MEWLLKKFDPFDEGLRRSISFGALGVDADSDAGNREDLIALKELQESIAEGEVRGDDLPVVVRSTQTYLPPSLK
jgi:hypothetical protein